MLWLADLICLSVIAFAVWMGIRVVIICRSRLNDFDIEDIHALVSDKVGMRGHEPFWSWVFPLTMGFILLSIIAFIARLSWALDIGWENSGNTWATVWLLWHTLAAALIALYHYGIIRIFHAYYEEDDHA